VQSTLPSGITVGLDRPLQGMQRAESPYFTVHQHGNRIGMESNRRNPALLLQILATVVEIRDLLIDLGEELSIAGDGAW